VSDLFWPGDQRAGEHFTDDRFLEQMILVEDAWLDLLVRAGVAPADAGVDLGETALPPHVLDWLANESEASGNPVTGVVELLRDGLGDDSPEAARWLHRGLTSQDVLDTAIVIGLRDAVADIRVEIARQVRSLVGLAELHRDTPMVARTLTQHAVPTTFAMKVAGWLTGVLDADDELARLTFPVQLGGAAGTMAAAVELGLDPSSARSQLAESLGLDDAPAWHTSRAPITRAGDALVRCTDAWGRIANDVLALGRPEIGELSEGAGGGSSTMPNKANPVQSVLVRRAGLAAPQLAATLHLAAAGQVDERADGAWHVEWDTLRTLVRRTLVAASQADELLTDLQVHPERMAATLAAARDDVRAEQRSMAELAGHQPAGDYLGQAGAVVDAVVARARRRLEENP
jgi:3-carboxy-cis,cis-muconate cycloisomerase